MAPDEVAAVLQSGEQVITAGQRENLFANIGSLLKTTGYSSTGSVVKNNNSPVSITMGDIILPDVTDASGFAKDLYNHIDLAFSQEFAKHFK